ncbi:FAD/NAD(P)-binding protein, partial [Yoonia sp.]|uniref:FAD/NAD(P)-binding protein n=1 Tax=Yoonia sp. TaxID=2212373 RepID=UPI00345C5C0A
MGFYPARGLDARVVIVGTGLSMVDHVVALLARGHRGTITCLSRRGLLPQPHVSGAAQPVGCGGVPLGASVSALLRWLRVRLRAAEAQGIPWQLVLDGLRPHVAAIWRSWDTETRARFLRHGASRWEVHRHRMPPQSARAIAAARDAGQLTLLRARFAGAVPLGGRTGIVTIRPDGTERMLIADHAIDCRGIRRNPETDSAPVIRDMLARGLARLDPLRLGLNTTPGARVITRGGVA